MSVASLTFRPLTVDIAFNRITHKVTVKDEEKWILSEASGTFKHGCLHAIMGPSGSGKSSLLNVLAGFNPVADGEIYFNGVNYPIAKWGDLITPTRSYIMQDDFLVAELTVREQLVYSVELKCPKEVPSDVRQQIVETILQKTGLTDCADRSIQVLSGGQRKRLCVASELVNYPPVLFLDEPTTGLDSTSCYRLVDLLKSLAQSGCNVIATIHQPNSRVFAMFDTLTVLAEKGVVAYNGPASSLAESLKRLLKVEIPQQGNPAEFLFEQGNIAKIAHVPTAEREKIIVQATAATQKKNEIMANMRKSWASLEGGFSSFNKEDPLDIALAKKIRGELENEYAYNSGKFKSSSADEVKYLCQDSLPSSSHRFKSIFKRTLAQARRDKVFMLGRLVAYIGTSALTGLTFQFVGNDRSVTMSNVSFLFILSFIFTSGTAIVTMMNSHNYLNVLLREHINSWYGVSSFYISRTIIEAAMNIVLSFIFGTIMWMMSSQQQETTTAVFSIICLLCVHCIAMHHFSFIIAMFVDQASLAQMPFAIMMMHTVFGGYFVPLDLLPIWIFWMKYVNFASFTFVASMKIAYATIIPGQPVAVPCKQANHPICNLYQNGPDVLAQWTIDPQSSFWNDIIALAVYSVVFAAIGWALIVVYLQRSRRVLARL